MEAVIEDLLSGQYNNPIRIVAFNTAERWSEDVSQDVAHELRRRCDLQLRDLPSSIQDFVERQEGAAWRQLTIAARLTLGLLMSRTFGNRTSRRSTGLAMQRRPVWVQTVLKNVFPPPKTARNRGRSASTQTV